MLLYILIFLHQTATLELAVLSTKRCISLYSYIKPQPERGAGAAEGVVYPYIPTSNRNHDYFLYFCAKVVYPYIPTSNRNYNARLMNWWVLYILIFLHQTATPRLHSRSWHCCISLYSYIKPQLILATSITPKVVYPYIPTSNRNQESVDPIWFALYILIFLHQTATGSRCIIFDLGCISLYSYIKPQLMVDVLFSWLCCISLYSYIKPQPAVYIWEIFTCCIFLYSYIKPQPLSSSVCPCHVVYPYIPTSNRNFDEIKLSPSCVVYPYIPTSNRNLIFRQHIGIPVVYPYIPTSNRNTLTSIITGSYVGYPYIPTSNRNAMPFRMALSRLYILIFLHQTATVIELVMSFR